MFWFLTISANILGTEGFSKEITIFIVGLLEITRLFLWNMIVVEKEHMLNIGEFKAIIDIKFPYDIK